MPFYKLSNSDLREYCKKHIETLEFWLRRLINDILNLEYGLEYWNAFDKTGNYLIKKEIREKVSNRISNHTNKYPRWIDATLFEHLIDIICKETSFKYHFKKVLISDTLLNREQVKAYLLQLAEVRNMLYHANHISVRQAERTICYSNDIIDAVKQFYKNEKKEMDFNAPAIIKYSDSNGKIYFREQFVQASNGIILSLGDTKLRCGEKIRIEIEVDSSFSPDEYIIQWIFGGDYLTDYDNFKSVDYELKEKNVGEVFSVKVCVISNKKWHRYNSYDDNLTILFTVLPPLLQK